MQKTRIAALITYTTIESIRGKSSFTKDNTYYYELSNEDFK